MTGSRSTHWILCALAIALAVAGCSTDTTTSGESTGSLDLNLELAPGVVINEVKWVISRSQMEDMMGTIDTSASGATASVEVFGLLPGDGYTVTLTAMVEGEDTPCIGSADFAVTIGVSTPVMVMLNCKRPERLGGVRVNGKFNVCAELAKVIVSPLQTSVGNDIDLSALAQDVDDDHEAIRYLWTGTGGTIADPDDRITTYTCEEVGDHTIVIRVSDDPEEFGEFCMDDWDVDVTCVLGDEPECEIDDDCDSGEVCDNNTCVPDVECNDDQDCDTGFVCDNFECVPDVECDENDDCDLGDICFDNVCRPDPDLFCDTGACVEDTELRAECVDKFLLCLADEINEEECIALSIAICDVDCNEDSDCGPLEVCENNACVPVECVIDNDCGLNEVCMNNVCVPDVECNMNSDCAPGEICESNVCVPDVECNLDDDCGPLEICENNECVAVDCKENNDCDPLEVCENNMCVPDVECNVDGDCLPLEICESNLCVEVDCKEDSDCLPSEVCEDNACVPGAIDPPKKAQTLTLGCTNNVTADVSILPFQLTVDPDAILGSTSTPAVFGGIAEFSEVFLDAAQGAVPGGVTEADLVNLAATVQIRTGGAMDAPVTLTNPPLETTCLIDSSACDPANDGASVPGSQPNTDCVPTGTFNPCQALVSIPTSTDCAPDGICDGLGKLESQCDINGFCVIGNLPLTLQDQPGDFTPAASGTVNFGFADQGTGNPIGSGNDVPVNTDGTYALPAAVFTSPPTPNEIKVNASGLSVALRCTMAVDSGGPDGVGVPDQASPTPNEDLITFDIQ